MAEPPLSSNVNTDRDWPAEVADTAVRLIDQVRHKTTQPAITAARAVVCGLIALAVGSLALFLFLIGLVRLINVYLPGKVWATYLLLGTVFTLGGFVLFSMRKPRTRPANPSTPSSR